MTFQQIKSNYLNLALILVSQTNCLLLCANNNIYLLCANNNTYFARRYYNIFKEDAEVTENNMMNMVIVPKDLRPITEEQITNASDESLFDAIFSIREGVLPHFKGNRYTRGRFLTTCQDDASKHCLLIEINSKHSMEPGVMYPYHQMNCRKKPTVSIKWQCS